MLTRLHVNNYAIIDEVEIDFSARLTTITGETGAGKSILLGALSLILGERAEATSFFDKNKKCVIEGYFNLKGLKLNEFFETNQLDYDEQTIIRREISPGGKSRAFVNDTPVNLQVLKELSSQLVDLHSQQETRELNDASFQLMLIDTLAQHDKLLDEYLSGFKQFKLNEKKLGDLQAQHDKALREQDYLQFQFNELSEAELETGEQDKIEQELNLQNNSEEIKKNLSASTNLLSNAESSVIDRLKEITGLLNHIQKFQPALEELIKRTESSRIELQDIAAELETMEAATSFEPARINELSNRLDLINRLEKKHQVKTVDELIQLQTSLEEQLKQFQSQDDLLLELRKTVTAQHTQLVKQADKLSKNRLAVVPNIEKQVNELLKDAGMPFAQIKIQYEKLSEKDLNETGLDRFRILLASNKGSDFIDLRKAASGGELSRLMLCLKSLIASSTALPTLIFDEIDTGISGETAVKVSRILKRLSANHQVICITHLPQIAGKGDAHYYVFKENTAQRTFTRVKFLSPDERIFEIAKMLSGEKPTPAALKNAKELITLN